MERRREWALGEEQRRAGREEGQAAGKDGGTEAAGVDVLMCAACRKRFLERRKLTNHEREVHGRLVSREREREWEERKMVGECDE